MKKKAEGLYMCLAFPGILLITKGITLAIDRTNDRRMFLFLALGVLLSGTSLWIRKKYIAPAEDR